MEKMTLKRLGGQLRKEIVPLEDLPYPMREALRKLAEKYDGPTGEKSGDDDERRSSHNGGPGQPSTCAFSKD